MYVVNLANFDKILECTQWKGGSMEIIEQKRNKVCMLEHRTHIATVKWTKNKVLTFSRLEQKPEDDPAHPLHYRHKTEEDLAEESRLKEMTRLQRMFDYIAAPIIFVTEYFLGNWEENPDWLPHRQYIDVVQKNYRLLDVVKTRPEDLLDVRINQGRFQDALELAVTYGLPTDQVFFAQWQSAPVTEESIQNFLDKISDLSIVLQTCCQRIPSTPALMKLLLEYGLQKTDILGDLETRAGRAFDGSAEALLALASLNLSLEEINSCICRRFFLSMSSRPFFSFSFFFSVKFPAKDFPVIR